MPSDTVRHSSGCHPPSAIPVSDFTALRFHRFRQFSCQTLCLPAVCLGAFTCMGANDSECAISVIVCLCPASGVDVVSVQHLMYIRSLSQLSTHRRSRDCGSFSGSAQKENLMMKSMTKLSERNWNDLQSLAISTTPAPISPCACILTVWVETIIRFEKKNYETYYNKPLKSRYLISDTTLLLAEPERSAIYRKTYITNPFFLMATDPWQLR